MWSEDVTLRFGDECGNDRKVSPVKSGAGSSFEANLCTHLYKPLYTIHYQLTPIPSLLRKEGSAHDLDSHIFKKFSNAKYYIQRDKANENMESA